MTSSSTLLRKPDIYLTMSEAILKSRHRDSALNLSGLASSKHLPSNAWP